MSIGTTLRNAVMVRLADPESEPVVDWCQANSERNAFDKDVLSYPSTKILAAYQDREDGKVVVYMPVQGAVILESIGSNPEASVQEITQAMIECVQGAALLAHMQGMREMFFLASDESTALGAEHLGFEKVEMALYRKRLA